jgi:hypothetical protein
MIKPQVLHLDVIKQVFRYLKCTIDHGILLKKNGFKKIEGFIDIDWVGDQENRRSWSTFGYIYFGLGTTPSHEITNVNWLWPWALQTLSMDH